MMNEWLVTLLIVMAHGSAHAAPASLVDEAHLGRLLKHSPQCCVIDARGAAARDAQPLPEALPYRGGLKIKPTSAVVVVADGDAKALGVAKLLAKASPHEVYAVKGGYTAWKQVEASLAQSAGATGTKFDFVIPHDTCQQGTPLQLFKGESDTAAQSKPK